LSFEHVTLEKEQHQPVAVVNYPQSEQFTRVTEYKHLTGQVHPRTSITFEYPKAAGDPYYPIPRAENQARYRQYEKLARTMEDVFFVGRLGTYMYYNMDQVVGQALATFKRIQEGVPKSCLPESREVRTSHHQHAAPAPG
jgi:UDP-galactopyranose mutase